MQIVFDKKFYGSFKALHIKSFQRKSQVSTNWVIRPREFFWGFSALWFLKYFGQFLSALAILGHSERFSPGKIRSEVGGPGGLFKAIGWPTSERILPGENLSEWPEIARALGNWPKYFKNHRAENPRKISRGLTLQGPTARLVCCFWNYRETITPSVVPH